MGTKINVDELHRGDIVIFQWNNQDWHTAVCLDTSVDEPRIAHCVNQGSVVESIASHMEDAMNVYAFRLHTKNFADRAVELALGWVRGRLPAYDKQRGGSVSSVRFQYNGGLDHGGGYAPFEYDALFRVMKWICRQEQFNKRDRGTTCCAFVMACFQSAAVSSYLYEQSEHWAADDLLNVLRDNRASKPDKDKLKKGENPYRIQLSNVGTKAREMKGVLIDDLWLTLRRNVLHSEPYDQTPLSIIMTPGLFWDAKFTYSQALYLSLRNDRDWAQLTSVER